MPIYEYLCKKCRKIYEIIHKHDDQTHLVCDDCSEVLEKQVGLSSFRLNGSGWAGATIKHGKNYYGEGAD